MDVLDVTPSSLRSAATVLRTAATGIADELEQLSVAADRLRLSWEGDAQAAFDLFQTRLRAQLGLSGERLTAIADSVEVLANAYGQVDRDAARGLGGQ